MNFHPHKRFMALLLCLLIPGIAIAGDMNNGLVTFGDSLSDTGNKYFVTGIANTPPYTELLSSLMVSDGPYTRGGLNHSNGATWIEQYARPLGLVAYVAPALRSEADARNYAYGGARARLDPVIIPNSNQHLPTQVDNFLADVNYSAPADALYVIFIGGNDIFDAVIALSLDGSGMTSMLVIEHAVDAVVTQVQRLAAAGAQKFVVLNAPDLGLTPAVKLADAIYSPIPGAMIAAASGYSQYYNLGLMTYLGNVPGIEIIDIYTAFTSLVNDPAAYGLSNSTDICVMPEQPPFTCNNPDEFVFWDGIHPTRVSHGILADVFTEALAE